MPGRKITYTVRYTDKGGAQSFLKAPAHQVVRRFPEGCRVEVYRDSLHGWEPATVLAALPVDELDSYASGSNSSGDSELEVLWDTVPVCLENYAKEGHVSAMQLAGQYRRVPVYLVRPCKSCPAICHIQI